MENISRTLKTEQIPVKIEIQPYLYDHIFNDQPVLPAVESIEILHKTILLKFPKLKIKSIVDINLRKFLAIPKNENTIEAINEYTCNEDGTITSKLLTVRKAKKTSITRKQEHIVVTFSVEDIKKHHIPIDIASSLEGTCFSVPHEKLYHELIFFGPSYHTTQNLLLTDEGAIATLRNNIAVSDQWSLGSPFILDGAFHSACAWGQRYLHFIGFPIAIEARTVFQPTRPDETYYAKIIPGEKNETEFKSDIYIYDNNGVLFETVTGLTLKDITRGALNPPDWIKENSDLAINDNLKNKCSAFTIIELKSISPFSMKSFSDEERTRTESMFPKRIESFTGSRLVCKRLWRQLSNNDAITAPEKINTILEDSQRPNIPVPGDKKYNCSVSHNKRFAIAVASLNKIGIDIETLSDRLIRTKKFYIKDEEDAMIEKLNYNLIKAYGRIWTIKEAISKAVDLNLVKTWEHTTVTSIHDSESHFTFHGKEHKAFHETIDDSIISLVILK